MFGGGGGVKTATYSCPAMSSEAWRRNYSLVVNKWCLVLAGTGITGTVVTHVYRQALAHHFVVQPIPYF